MHAPISLRELPLALSNDDRSLQIAIYEALRTAMLDGRLAPGARLPSSRDLAAQLHVARGTVVIAYEHLTAEGYLRSARGAGTFVAPGLPDRWFAPKRAQPAVAKRERAVTLSERGALLARSPFPRGVLTAPRPFRPHTPAIDAFPRALWGRLVARHARRAGTEVYRDADPRGYAPLRAAIAEHLRVARGVVCAADQVVVATGTQQALDLAARLLLNEGDSVWMEDPGHFGARNVLLAAGARVVPIPVDRDGIDVDEGIAQSPDARLVYVTPARQSPLGATLPLERRMKLLEWAGRSDAWIFEDDYDSEFRYEGRPSPALQALDARGVVIHSGTFSKSMFPGIRLAYVVLPDALVDPFSNALSLVGRYTPLLPQLALTDFIVDGDFGRHLRRMRNLYGERRESLLNALATELADEVEVVGSNAGLELALRLPPGFNDRAVTKFGIEGDLEMLPLSRYAIKPLRRGGLVLGFAAVSALRARRAIPALRKAIMRARPARREGA